MPSSGCLQRAKPPSTRSPMHWALPRASSASHSQTTTPLAVASRTNAPPATHHRRTSRLQETPSRGLRARSRSCSSRRVEAWCCWSWTGMVWFYPDKIFQTVFMVIKWGDWSPIEVMVEGPRSLPSRTEVGLSLHGVLRMCRSVPWLLQSPAQEANVRDIFLTRPSDGKVSSL